MSNYVISTDVNGSFEVLSGIVNDKLTSLNLIGRGAAGYGQAIAENTIRQLSNFASGTAPLYPIKGQLWYDTGAQQIKVYNTSGTWSIIPNADSTYWAQFLTEAEAANTYAAKSGVVRTDATSLALTDNAYDIGGVGKRFKNIYAVTFQGIAVQAQYADLAERYEADKPMSAGDLVDIGGEKEITLTTEAWQSAYGVISTDPAYMMNSHAGDDTTHPYVALVGRVPVKVIGQVAKGDRLTASDIPGVAMSAGKGHYEGIFGRALNAKTTDELGFVEVALGAK